LKQEISGERAYNYTELRMVFPKKSL